jgi:hypothetical protein
MIIIFYTFFSYCSFFTITKFIYPESKTRVYVSLINSIILSAYSLYSFWNFQLHDVKYFLDSSPNYSLTNYTIGYFAADLFLGHFLDRKNLNLLSGYIHHIVFIGLATYINNTGEANIIYLFVPFEIPTMILDLTRIYESVYLNYLFASNFFIFRILYHLYLTSIMWNYNSIYGSIVILLLCVHLHWFKLWFKKENKRLVKTINI